MIGQRCLGETSTSILLKSIFLFGPPQQTPAMPTRCECKEERGRSCLQPRPHHSPQQQLAVGRLGSPWTQQHVPHLPGGATDWRLLRPRHLPDQAPVGCRSDIPSCHGESWERARGCTGCTCVGPVQPAVACPRGMRCSSRSGKLQACLI